LEDDVDDFKNFDQDGEASSDDIGFFGLIGFGDEGDTVADGGDGGINFSAFAFADDSGEHLHDVVIGAVDVFTVAGSAITLNDAPFGEVAKVHARVAPGDVEPFDHLIHGEILPGDEEEGVELSHGSVDAPARAHAAPFHNEHFLCADGLWGWFLFAHTVILRLLFGKLRDEVNMCGNMTEHWFGEGGSFMAKISAQDFVGTRARFQRIGDAKLFAGWIEDFFGHKVVISTNTNHAVQIGDEFRFEGFGNHIAVVFHAKLEAVAKLDLTNAGVVTAVEGTNARIVEAKRVKLELQVSSPVRFSASNENLRMLAPDVFTVLNEGANQVEGFMIDIAKQGIGFVSKKKVKPKEYVEVRMETRIGTIEAKGNIRYCIPDKDRDGFYRVGIMFTDLDRVNRPRWDRFLSQNHES